MVDSLGKANLTLNGFCKDATENSRGCFWSNKEVNFSLKEHASNSLLSHLFCCFLKKEPTGLASIFQASALEIYFWKFVRKGHFYKPGIASGFTYSLTLDSFPTFLSLGSNGLKLERAENSLSCYETLCFRNSYCSQCLEWNLVSSLIKISWVCLGFSSMKKPWLLFLTAFFQAY